jgi:DnaJ-class molecular chaperone
MGQKNKYCSTKILLIRIRYGTPVSEMSRNICVRDATEHRYQRCHGTYASEMSRNTCQRCHGTRVSEMATEHLC